MMTTTSPARSAAAPAPVRRRHRIGWLLPVSTGQIAVWELAAIAVLVVVFAQPADPVLTGVVSGLAAVAVLGSSLRIGGQCGYQWLGTYLKYLPRRKGKNAAGATPVRSLEPDLTIHTHMDRNGNRVGITTLGDDPGYSVTVRLAPSVHPDPRTLLDLLHRTFERTDIPLATAQLVAWSVPAHRVSPAPITVYWLAVRYRHDDAPWAALARGEGRTGAFKAVSSAALRLVSDLAEVGYDASVLDTLDLHNELVVGVGAGQEPMFGSGLSYEATERWHTWGIGDRRQVCLLPRAPGDVLPLIGRCLPDSVFTCTSYTLRRTAQGNTRADAVVRIGLPPDHARIDTRQTGRLGVALVAAHGRHARHVVRSLPLALP